MPQGDALQERQLLHVQDTMYALHMACSSGMFIQVEQPGFSRYTPLVTSGQCDVESAISLPNQLTICAVLFVPESCAQPSALLALQLLEKQQQQQWRRRRRRRQQQQQQQQVGSG
jgi:hypothetical protein